MTEYYGNLVTNLIATPPTVNDGKVGSGSLVHVGDSWEYANNGNGDYTVVLPVPVDGIPTSLKYASDDLTSGTTDVGLYKSDGDGTFTAVDDDCFASAIAQGSGAVALTEVLYEAAATNIANARKPFWQWAGLSARPAYDFMYISVTNDTGTGAAGSGLLECYYKKG